MNERSAKTVVDFSCLYYDLMFTGYRFIRLVLLTDLTQFICLAKTTKNQIEKLI